MIFHVIEPNGCTICDMRRPARRGESHVVRRMRWLVRLSKRDADGRYLSPVRDVYRRTFLGAILTAFVGVPELKAKENP